MPFVGGMFWAAAVAGIVYPGSAELVLTCYAPVVSVSQQLVLPVSGALVLAGAAPTVAATATVQAQPTAGALVLSGQAPTVAQGTSTATAAGALVLTGYAPTVVGRLTKWDSANMGPSNVLSNGDMTATVTAADRCYATTGYAAGEKRYFEILVGAQANTYGVIALSNQDNVINTIYDSSACSVTSEFAEGDVVGVCLDTTADTAIHTFYVNNSQVRTRTLGASSSSITYLPCVGDQWSNTAGSTFVFTGRFKSADMTYSPPSGFTAWDS